MAQSVVLGPTAKVDIGYIPAGTSFSLLFSVLTPLRVVSGRIDDGIDVAKTTDTDSINGCDEFFPESYSRATVELEVQMDLDMSTNPVTNMPVNNASVNMFTRPLLLSPGRTISMIIWPQGRPTNVGAAPVSSNSNWRFCRLLLKKGTQVFAVQGSQPQRAVISGVSSSYFKRPYETDLGGPVVAPTAEVLLALSNRNPPAPP